MRVRLGFLGTFGGLLACLPAEVHAQTLVCGDGQPPRVTIGVGRYHCVGGACRIWGVTGEPAANTLMSQEGGRAYWQGRWEAVRRSFEFTVEPSLWDIDPAGPAHGRIEEGDVLIAVAGLPVTSERAGRLLGDPPPGAPIDLTVRRSGAIVQAEVTPSLSCDATTLSMGMDQSVGLRVATRGFDPEGDDRRGSLLGLGLRCDECAPMADAGGATSSWRFGQYPVVVIVQDGGPAAMAGIVEGDRLTHVDGLDLLSVEGAVRLSRLSAGEEVEVRAERDGSERVFVVRIPG